jgi:mannose-1-phosphate guanylyltransferase
VDRDWAIVLAAGEGSRLRELTTDENGVVIPKQFCALGGRNTLLEAALRRAQRVAPLKRTLVVVAREHYPWWSRQLRALPAGSVIVQPRNRGTAPGALLPLLTVLARDQRARVLILPSDHFVADEDALAASARQAMDQVAREPERVALLGIAPDGPDPQYGWIVPGRARGRGLYEVASFVEKPEPALARALMARGGLWNSFLVAASAPSLLALYRRRIPELFGRLARAHANGRAAAVTDAYERMGASWDFSRDLIQGSEPVLRLLRVPSCGWSDLGTPERVTSCLDQLAQRGGNGERRAGLLPTHRAPVVDLAWAARRWRLQSAAV